MGGPGGGGEGGWGSCQAERGEEAFGQVPASPERCEPGSGSGDAGGWTAARAS